MLHATRTPNTLLVTRRTRTSLDTRHTSQAAGGICLFSSPEEMCVQFCRSHTLTLDNIHLLSPSQPPLSGASATLANQCHGPVGKTQTTSPLPRTLPSHTLAAATPTRAKTGHFSTQNTCPSPMHIPVHNTLPPPPLDSFSSTSVPKMDGGGGGSLFDHSLMRMGGVGVVGPDGRDPFAAPLPPPLPAFLDMHQKVVARYHLLSPQSCTQTAHPPFLPPVDLQRSPGN